MIPFGFLVAQTPGPVGLRHELGGGKHLHRRQASDQDSGQGQRDDQGECTAPRAVSPAPNDSVAAAEGDGQREGEGLAGDERQPEDGHQKGEGPGRTRFRVKKDRPADRRSPGGGLQDVQQVGERHEIAAQHVPDGRRAGRRTAKVGGSTEQVHEHATKDEMKHQEAVERLEEGRDGVNPVRWIEGAGLEVGEERCPVTEEGRPQGQVACLQGSPEQTALGNEEELHVPGDGNARQREHLPQEGSTEEDDRSDRDHTPRTVRPLRHHDSRSVRGRGSSRAQIAGGHPAAQETA